MTNNTLQTWNACLDIIRDNLNPTQFETWFAPIRPLSFKDNELKIEVPSQFFYEFLEEHYLDLMRLAIGKTFGQGTQLMYHICTDRSNQLGQEQSSSDEKKPQQQREVVTPPLNKTPMAQPQGLNSQLNPKYNFDNFLEGTSNKLSRTVGQAVAENPSRNAFNPLFIYGASGVGKTHLVNAIGCKIKQDNPNSRVLYISAHLFMVQYTDSVRNNKVNDFINFYQSIDVLIIDDIQEMSGLTKTQNTFFHIFNHLHLNGKQLILTADRTPAQMQGFEDRMLTRFKWGMLAELERPNEDLRRAIVMRKIKRDGLQIPEDVISFITKHVQESVRDLEGIINSLMAYSVVYNCDINMELAERVVGRVVSYEKKSIQVNDILLATCETFKVTQEDIFSRSRKRPIALARQAAMYLTQKYTDLALSRIGAEIGNRDHATVLHSIKQIKEQLTLDSDLSQKINEVEVTLNQH